MNVKKRNVFHIPVRYIVAALVMLATFNVYLCRINLSIAIVAMSKGNGNKSSADGYSGESDVCYDYNTASNTSSYANTTESKESKGEFDWDEKTQGIILGAFFYGYILFQVLGGRLSEKFGAKWLCGGGIAMSIVINALTPVIAKSGGYYLLLASRVALGMFQALVFPSCYALFSKWAPDHERSTVLSFPTIGGNIGTIATSGLSGYLSEHGFAGGWPSVFYVSAIIACLWLLCWILYVKSEPRDHKWITSEEIEYIENNIKGNSKAKNPVPWRHIFTSIPVLATIIVKFTYNWNYILFLLKLPAYLHTVFGYSVSQVWYTTGHDLYGMTLIIVYNLILLSIVIFKNGLINSCVYIAITISLFIAGFVSDIIIRKEVIHKTYVRKIFQTIATFGGGLCMAAIPSVNCNKTLVIALLMVGMLLFGMNAGGDIPVVADMTNQFSATVFAIANTVAFSCGFITPLVIGVILEASPHLPRQQWNYIFYMSAAMNVFGGIVFILMGSAEQQHWDKDHNKKEIILRI